jgi:hypothetical protein
VRSVEGARRAAKRGTWAAALGATVTSTAVLRGRHGLTAWNWIDVLLVVLIAWGIYRMSRVAAIAGLVLYIIERIPLLFAETTAPILAGRAFFGLFMLLLFVNGVRGTFAHHRLVTSAHHDSEITDAAEQ